MSQREDKIGYVVYVVLVIALSLVGIVYVSYKILQ
jgi:hypothetical protein